VLKADLHVHSYYSPDSGNSLEDIIGRCNSLGINCIALCDHGTVEGALKLQAMADFKVIVAEEVPTPKGEIMGMFLKETIPSGISVAEAINRIRAQGGLVCIPHPYDHFRPSAMDGETLESIAGEVDIVEVFNARTIPFQDMRRPGNFARYHNLVAGAGSDAHTLAEIGHAYVEMPEFDGPDEFLKSLAGGKIYRSRSSLFVHFRSLGHKLRKKMLKVLR
jgi:predicted metal-dependent phosphoesterase TrpH